MLSISIEIFEAFDDVTERRVYDTYIQERGDKEYEEDIKRIKDPMLTDEDRERIYNIINIYEENIKKPSSLWATIQKHQNYIQIRMRKDAKCVNRDIEAPVIYRRKLINAM